MLELRANFADVDDVREGLQQAVELEFSTIPPYLFALWSITDRRSRAAELIASVVAEEMLHMALACNILNAVGGAPVLTDPAFVPRYPTRLPGGVDQAVEVGLRRADLGQLEVFKRIERPVRPVDIQVASALGPQVTIGEFYDRLAATIDELGPDVFTGDPGRQLRQWPIVGDTGLRPVEDPVGARWAIRLIKEQGEGVSHHDPTDRDGELAHYYRFWEIIEGREIVLRGRTWTFGGAEIPRPQTVPVADNPRVQELATGSAAWRLAVGFADNYRRLLRALERCFNGQPAELDRALALMYALRVQAVDLFRHPSAREDGTVAGPTFEYLVEEVPTAVSGLDRADPVIFG